MMHPAILGRISRSAFHLHPKPRTYHQSAFSSAHTATVSPKIPTTVHCTRQVASTVSSSGLEKPISIRRLGRRSSPFFTYRQPNLLGFYNSTANTVRTYSTMGKLDPNTLSNYHVYRVRHTVLNISLDFDNSVLHGTADLNFKFLGGDSKAAKEIVLDTAHLKISGVKWENKSVLWQFGDEVPPYGKPLKIAAPKTFAEGDEFTITISFSTTAECTALQWMKPSQTSNKKHPYMFSQCQAIHCRSLFPCQDTPGVKSTIEYNIRSPLPVVASGIATGVSEYSGDGKGTLVYRFKQPIPIPSYLVAIAAGDLAQASVGPRSSVVTGPEELLKCKKELEGDVEKFIDVAEKLIFPYPWTTYNVLILPPSFPYGGMENPQITFATPTIISGDKSNIDVIAHELAHSWSGNLVTNASWQDFWLNEGWTTYIERRIQGALYGEQSFHFSAIIGWKALKESVKLFGDDHEFTKLVQNLEGKDPDDAFSSVPYEKGFNFLYYLDRTVGREAWDKFIPHYFSKYKEKSLTTEEFKATLLDFFASDADASGKLKAVDWDGWLHKPGMPIVTPKFDTSLVDKCYELANHWEKRNVSGSWDGFKPSEHDIDGWISGQKVAFLERIQDWEKTMKPELVHELNEVYKFDKSENAEIVSRYLNIGLRAEDKEVYDLTAYWLGKWGRMKFVRPLYRLLNKCDRNLALKTFEKNIDFYHPICRDIVKKDLGL